MNLNFQALNLRIMPYHEKIWAVLAKSSRSKVIMEREDPRNRQYGQQGQSDHRHTSGPDSRRLDERANPKGHEYHHYSHQPPYDPYSLASRAEPQVGASGHRGGEGSYQYCEQGGSGSRHGKGSRSGECEPAPIRAGVTYPVPRGERGMRIKREMKGVAKMNEGEAAEAMRT